MQKEKLYRLVYLIFGLVILQNCASYKLDSAQMAIRKSYASGNLENTRRLLNKFGDKNIYKSKDEVLYKLETGTIYHFAGQYDSSYSALHQAEAEMNRLFTKSITRGLSSILLNDNQLAYDGEDYESIYINIFNSLNFIHQNNLEDALVEARRVSYKLQYLNIRYKGLLETLSHADTTQKVVWKSGTSNIQNSALGHFLAGVLYAKSGRTDDARIEYEQLLKAFNDQPGYFSPEGIDLNDIRRLTEPGKYNLLFITFTGRSPIKYQVDSRFFLPEEHFYLKISLPVLQIIPSMVQSVYATIDDSLSVPLYLIENMDIVAQEVYRVKEPIIYARSFLRSFLKATGTHLAAKKAKKEGHKTLGNIIGLAGILASEATEKADLRGWQTMPGQAYANLFKLPPGKHDVRIDYIGYNNRLLFSEHKTIAIKPGNPLNLTETLFWN